MKKIVNKKRRTITKKLILGSQAILLMILVAMTSCNDVDIAVKEVIISESEATIVVGGAPFALSYTINPSSATNTTVSWRSNDENIASVNKDGIVTAIAKGNVVITVITKDGEKKDHCTITVIDGSQNEACNIISFRDATNNKKWDIVENTITATYPVGSDVSSIVPTITISPSSSITPGSGIAQNFENGNTVKYTVKAEDGTTRVYTASAIVEGVAPILSSQREIISFKDGNKEWTIDPITYLITTEYPFGTDLSTIVPTITISPKATITPESGVAQDFNNEVTYMVTAENGEKQGYKAKATVEAQVLVTDVNFNGKDSISVEMKVGTILRLKTNVVPANATIKTVTWTSDNTTVATVSTDGAITALEDGEAIITVTTTDGGFEARCYLTVIFDANKKK